MSYEKLNWHVQLVGIEGSVTTIKVADTEQAFLSTTVAKLRRLVHKKWPEIETDYMRLLYAGKQLNDEEDSEETTLNTYRVKNRSTIHVVIKIHGGGCSHSRPTRTSSSWMNESSDSEESSDSVAGEYERGIAV